MSIEDNTDNNSIVCFDVFQHALFFFLSYVTKFTIQSWIINTPQKNLQQIIATSFAVKEC